MYLIWTNEHKAWWRPNSRGYTSIVSEAGRYSLTEAIKICNGANYSWDEDRNPNELPISEESALYLNMKGN